MWQDSSRATRHSCKNPSVFCSKPINERSIKSVISTFNLYQISILEYSQKNIRNLKIFLTNHSYNLDIYDLTAVHSLVNWIKFSTYDINLGKNSINHYLYIYITNFNLQIENKNNLNKKLIEQYYVTAKKMLLDLIQHLIKIINI